MKLSLIGLIVLVHFYEINGLVTQSQCADGPTYWCQNLITSKECHATEHCMQTVWSKQKHQENKYDCSTCQALIANLKMYQENEIENELENFNSICKQSNFDVSCDSVLNVLVPDFIENLSTYMDDDQFCKLIKMCQPINDESEEITNDSELSSVIIHHHHHHDPHGRSIHTGACNMCLTVITVIENFLGNHEHIVQIGNLLKHLCPHFIPSCPKLVDMYLPLIMNIIAHIIQPLQTCHMILICPNHVENLDFQYEMDSCDQCNSVVKIANNFFSNSTFMINQINELSRVHCLNDESCMEVIGAHAGNIQKFLFAAMDSQDEVCEGLSLC